MGGAEWVRGFGDRLGCRKREDNEKERALKHGQDDCGGGRGEETKDPLETRLLEGKRAKIPQQRTDTLHTIEVPPPCFSPAISTEFAAY